MGVKLRENVSPLEASIEDGMLKVYFFDEVIKSIKLENFPKSIKIGRQCNFTETALNNVIGFLRSDKFCVIIRYDGTVDILTNDFVLLTRGKVCVGDIMDNSISICYAGSLSFLSTTSPAYLAEMRSKYVFLFSEKTAVTILLDLNDYASKLVYDWAKTHDDVGTMHIVDNSTAGSKLWVNFGTVDNFQLKGYKVLYANGVVGGIL